MSTRTPPGAAKECAGIGDLADRAGVRLREQLRDGSGTAGTEDAGAALSHTNLRGIVRLRDDVVGQIAHVEEPATHGVEFHIDQSTRFNHDFSLQVFVGSPYAMVLVCARSCVTAAAQAAPNRLDTPSPTPASV